MARELGRTSSRSGPNRALANQAGMVLTGPPVVAV